MNEWMRAGPPGHTLPELTPLVRDFPDGQCGASQSLHPACCLVLPSVSFAFEKPKKTSHAISFSPTPPDQMHPHPCRFLITMWPPGDYVHQVKERRSRMVSRPSDSTLPPRSLPKSPPGPPGSMVVSQGLHALSVSRVPYHLSWNHDWLGGKERKEKSGNYLSVTPFPKILEPWEAKLADVMIFGQINNVK